MTNKEAIETIKIAAAEVEWEYPLDYQIAFDRAIEALEKQIPKTAIKDDDAEIRYVGVYKCPTCGGGFTGTLSKFCYHCGQAIDWSKECWQQNNIY